jgi:type IV secretory pathway TraG/TraD family ATPase VirD4
MVAPVQDGKLSAAVSALFLGRLSHAIYDRLSTGGGRPVVLVIDEAARILDRVRIEEFISVARSANASVVLALQDAAQIKDENERSTILSNCATYVSLHGVSRASADYLSSRLGDGRVSYHSSQATRSPGHWRRIESTSLSSELAPVLGPREIMAPPFGLRSSIVHARDVSDHPFVVDLARSD